MPPLPLLTLPGQTPGLVKPPGQAPAAAAGPSLQPVQAPAQSGGDSLDPQAIALAKAIRQTESGGDWNKPGKSGEWGAYQFTPATWTAYAQETGVNAPFGAATPDQQNEVAYKMIKKWKDQGYNVGQIASMWNAGGGRPDAYLQNHRGTNSKGVEYDTPAYASKVAEAYQRLKGEQRGQQDAPMPGAGEGDGTFLGDAGNHVSGAATRLADAIGRGASGEINPLSALIQSGGAVASGVANVTNDALTHLPVVGGLVKGLEGVIGKGAQAAAGTQAGQGLISTYQGFAAQHPELAADIGSGVDIATALPILKGLGMAKNAVKGAADAALHGSKDAVYEALAPNLGPVGTANAIMQRGVQSKGLLRVKSIAPDPEVLDQAALIKKYVPKFDPNDMGKSLAATQTAVNGLKASLKKDIIEGGADRIYPTKELISRLKKIEKPLLISRDTTLRNVYNDLVTAVGKIAEKQGGKVSELGDLLSDFDGLVKKQFPNLYKSDTLTPLRQGVKDMRETIKNFAVEKLPPGTGLKERMLEVHKMLNAMQSMSKKAGVGKGKEIGTSAVSRLGKRHPMVKGILKTGATAALQGAGIGSVMKILD